MALMYNPMPAADFIPKIYYWNILLEHFYYINFLRGAKAFDELWNFACSFIGGIGFVHILIHNIGKYLVPVDERQKEEIGEEMIILLL